MEKHKCERCGAALSRNSSAIRCEDCRKRDCADCGARFNPPKYVMMSRCGECQTKHLRKSKQNIAEVPSEAR